MRVVEERNSYNQPIARYTRGTDLSGTLEGAGGIGGLLAMSVPSSGGWSHHYYHADGNGNITAMMDQWGTLSAAYRYDPYGRTIVQNGPMATTNAYRFSSKEHHEQSGLYYYGYRFYSPELQRWLNRDPIAENGGINLYGFVGNNGVNKWDVLGLAGFGNRFGIPESFWNWYHRQYKCKGDPDIGREEAEDLYKEWVKEGKPNPEGSKTVPGEEENEEEETYPSEDGLTIQQKVAVGAGAAGVGYLIYRGIRMIPSLFPPLWPTLPANAAIP